MTFTDYTLIKKLILEEILLDKTTAEMSRSLEFSFDKYKRWMDNTKILKWDEFIELVEKVGLNLTNANKIIAHESGEENLFQYLKLSNFFETNQDVADYLNCHVSVVKRYLQSDTIPDVEVIFKMMDYRQHYFAAYIYRLFEGKFKNAKLKKWIEISTKDPFFKFNDAIVGLIESTLKLKAYEGRTETTDLWLSEVLDIDLIEIQFNLRNMLKANTITLTANDHYGVNSNTTNSYAVSYKDMLPFLQNINQKAIEMLEKKKIDPEASPKPGIVSTQIYPASKETADAINMVMKRAYAEIYKLIEEDKGEYTDTFCLLLQNFRATKPF